MINTLATKWPVSNASWIQWFDQWITLLNAGLPVLDALDLSVTMQANVVRGKPLTRALLQVTRDIKAGANLCEAFEKATPRLPREISLALLCAQNTGDFAGQLRAHCERWQRWMNARKALLNSLCYPVFVLVCALLCCWFLNSQPLSVSAEVKTIQSPESAWINGLAGAGLLGLLCLLPAWFQQARPASHTPLRTAGHWLPTKALVSANYFFLIASELDAGIDLLHCLRPRASKDHTRLPGAGRHWNTLNRLSIRLVQGIHRGQGLYLACMQAKAPAVLCQQIDLAQHTGHLAQAFHLTARVCEAQALMQLNRIQALAGPVLLLLSGAALALAYQSNISPLYDQLGHFG